jgi:hypothetical protein
LFSNKQIVTSSKAFKDSPSSTASLILQNMARLPLYCSRPKGNVGDANGSLKVVNLTTNSIVANISVTSTERADKMAYDSETGTVVCTIPNETPPRVAVISANNHTFHGYVTFTDTSGLDQHAWKSVDKQLYISVPSTKVNPGGADVNSFNMTQIPPLPQCVPVGIVFGSQQKLFVSCSRNQILAYNISNILIMNVTTGNVVPTSLVCVVFQISE